MLWATSFSSIPFESLYGSVTYRAEVALPDKSLSLSNAVDLCLVPLTGTFHHLQPRQQRVLLLLQLLHLLQLWRTTGHTNSDCFGVLEYVKAKATQNVCILFQRVQQEVR